MVIAKYGTVILKDNLFISLSQFAAIPWKVFKSVFVKEKQS